MACRASPLWPEGGGAPCGVGAPRLGSGPRGGGGGRAPPRMQAGGRGAGACPNSLFWPLSLTQCATWWPQAEVQGPAPCSLGQPLGDFASLAPAHSSCRRWPGAGTTSSLDVLPLLPWGGRRDLASAGLDPGSGSYLLCDLAEPFHLSEPQFPSFAGRWSGTSFLLAPHSGHSHAEAAAVRPGPHWPHRGPEAACDSPAQVVGGPGGAGECVPQSGAGLVGGERAWPRPEGGGAGGGNSPLCSWAPETGSAREVRDGGGG